MPSFPSSSEKKEFFKLLIREFHERPLPDLIKRELVVPTDTGKVITIYGPRRSGKTFYFYQLIQSLLPRSAMKKAVYINLEDERLLPLDSKELHLLLEAYYELYPENKDKLLYFFLDEIQTVSNWEVFVRRLSENQNCRIFLTGSSAKLLSREISTSLRGRALSYRLLPFSFREFLKLRGVNYQLRTMKYSKERFDIKKGLSDFMDWGGIP